MNFGETVSKYVASLFVATTLGFCSIGMQAEDFKGTGIIDREALVASTHAADVEVFERTAVAFTRESALLTKAFEKVFSDPKSSNQAKCSAAYYLGELHAADAVGSLASEIALVFDTSDTLIKHFPIIMGNPAMDALVKIGNPAIPALIRNLAEYDDAKVRELSLKALYRVEGDKDVVQLRLQKALSAERNSQKQARLQSALKALAENSF